MPVFINNDGDLFAYGEALGGTLREINAKLEASGSPKRYRNLVGFTLGTGFGSAFIENKVPVVTGDSVPKLGCVYHIKYEEGIADDYFSTRWFISRYKQLTGKDAEGVKGIAEDALKSEQVKEMFTEFGDSLAGFLAPFLNNFGADVLVMGGNISRAYDLFGETFEKGLAENNCPTRTFTSDLMEDAALLGSAYLLDGDFWNAVKVSLKYM